HVTFPRVLLAAIYAFTLSPLFVLLAGWYLLDSNTSAPPQSRSTKLHWLIAAILVGTAAGVPAFAKIGGSYNSLLLAWVPMTALCVAILPDLFDRLRELNSPRAPLGAMLSPVLAGWFVGGLIIFQTFGVGSSDRTNWDYGHGDASYPQVVDAVRN